MHPFSTRIAQRLDAIDDRKLRLAAALIRHFLRLPPLDVGRWMLDPPSAVAPSPLLRRTGVGCYPIPLHPAVLVFSPFTEALDRLLVLLNGAQPGEHCVKPLACAIADGRLAPDARAALCQRFTGSGSTGCQPVDAGNLPASPIHCLLATYDSLSEGYDLPRCSRIICLGLPEAMDKLLQAEDRGNRLNSEEDLHVYRLVSAGTVEETIAQQSHEKRSTSQTILDAQW